jgi:small subunit ribosomal protein S20
MVWPAVSNGAVSARQHRRQRSTRTHDRNFHGEQQTSPQAGTAGHGTERSERLAAFACAGDKKAALETLSKATSVIDSIADKNVIHKNTAARNKSRLAAAVKAMA